MAEDEKEIIISMLLSMNKEKGHVSRFFSEQLSKNKPIICIDVQGDIMPGILERRGFVHTTRILTGYNIDKGCDETVEKDVWVYEPKK